MATEGQTAVGPNGERAVFRNGQWEVVSAGGQASPQVSVTPLPRNPADVAREARDNARNAAGDSRDEARLGLTVEDKNRQRGNDNFNQTTNLASSFSNEPVVKTYRVAIGQLAQALATKDGPQGDLALTYAFAKAMDPDSVVRDAEQGMVIESQPWFKAKIEAIRKQFSVEGSGNFTPETRAALRQEIITSVAQRNKSYLGRREFYTKQAQHFGIDPQYVVGQHDGTEFMPALEAYTNRQRQRQEPVNAMSTPSSLASGGDGEKSIPIPQGMQQAHADYLAQNWGRLTPEGYTQFRAGLDQQYGFEPRPDEYAAIVPNLNERAQQGGSPQGMNIPPVNAPMDAQDRLNNSVFNNGFGSAMLGVADMTGGIDEAAAGVRSMMNGTDYSVELDRANALKGALRDVSPWAYMGGNVAGSIVAGGIAAKMAPGLASAAQTMPGMLGIGAAYGGGTGALEGNDSRWTSAAIGAGAGVAGGAAGRYAIAPAAEALMRTGTGRATSNVIRGAINRAKPGAVEATSNAPVMDAATARIVGAAPDVGAVRTNLEDASRLGLPFSLADASPELRALGGAVTRRSVGARGMVENIVEPRARGQADRAIEAIDSRLAPIGDIDARRRELWDAGNAASSPIYQQAGAQRMEITPEIQAILDRPEGKAALQRAFDIARNSGRNPQELGFVMNEAGEVQLPSDAGRWLQAGDVDPRAGLDRVTARTWNGGETTKVGPTDLVTWLRMQGGLADSGGELGHMGLTNRMRPKMDHIGQETRFGPLVSNDGMNFDDAALRAWESGYFPELSDRPDVNTFLNALRDTYDGVNRRFKADDMEAVRRFADETDQRWNVRRAAADGAPIVEDMSRPAGQFDYEAAPPSAYGQTEAQLPTFEALDLVKKGLDARLSEARDAMGNLDLRGNPSLQAIDSLRGQLVSALDRVNPDYSRARGEFAKYAKRADALDVGRGMFGGTVPRRTFDSQLAQGQAYDGKVWNDLDRTVPEMQRGYAAAMGDAVDRTRLSGNPYEAIYGSPLQQSKVGAMFPEGAQDFGRIYDLEREMAKTTRETIGGSPTAGRLQADSQLGDAMGAGLEIGADVLTGGGASGLGTIIGAVRRSAGDGLRLGVGKAAERRAEQVAPVLFNTNPQEALGQLDGIAFAMDAIRKRKADFARRSGMFGALVAPGASFGLTE